MIDEDGLYRAPSKKTLMHKASRIRPRGRKSTVSQWAPRKRHDFEREILAGQKTLREIGQKYGVSVNSITNYKIRVLGPAIRAAEQQMDIDQRDQARQHLEWLYSEAKDSIEQLKYGQPVIDPETGLPQVDPETGEEIRKKADPKLHGTVSQLLQAARPIVEKIGEVSGEFKTSEQDSAPRIIQVITIPKIGEQVQDLPAAIPVKAIAAPEETPEDEGGDGDDAA